MDTLLAIVLILGLAFYVIGLLCHSRLGDILTELKKRNERER